MKFGKKLAAEASRLWSEHWLDYKLLKRALKHDVQAADPLGLRFEAALLNQLSKVSSFYIEKAEELEELLASELANAPEELARAQVEIQELIKFVALNYLAVVKGIKKRNRHLKDALVEASVMPLHPMDILSTEVFFTSPRLAALATQAEVAAQDCGGFESSAAEVLQEYQCPICLELLRSPVVLTCAHRFCWGCLVAHFASLRSRSRSSSSPGCPGSGASAGEAADCSLVVLEKLVAACQEAEEQQQGFYACPCCRKPQVLNIESLQVDSHLSKFIDGLKLTLKLSGVQQQVATPSAATPEQQQQKKQKQQLRAVSQCTCRESQPQQQPCCLPDAAESVEQPATPLCAAGQSLAADDDSSRSRSAPSGLLPPQLPQHYGKMTLLLDLDGTLVSSFTPRRAPKLPPSMRTHLVGRGSRLNPGGVFVVERPGLQQFLEQVAALAEVVVFTAGLEDYAAPIIDAIDPGRARISAAIYREATVRTEHYQCVKDMAVLGRELSKCVLVDDTPLAFLHQPCNGVPVLAFRGDPDDRLLMEAVLPLLQALSSALDVRSMLDRRFEMRSWFKRHGYPINEPFAAAKKAIPKCTSASSLHEVQAAAPVPQQSIQPVRFKKHTLVLTDFDKTLIDHDAGERVMEELAPELLPMLAALESPANFVPITNNLLAELQRRGVSRDRLLATLQGAGQDMPAGTVKMLKFLARKQVDVKIISDCNSIFISHMLTGAHVQACVTEVITNSASFLRVEKAADASLSGSACRPPQPHSHATLLNPILGASVQRSAEHRLVISPRHAPGEPPHGCRLCPENLCKGSEVRRIKASGAYMRVLYLGDGANDVCPALELEAGDVVLARRDFALERYLSAALGEGSKLRRPHARVVVWESHEQLQQLVQELVK